LGLGFWSARFLSFVVLGFKVLAAGLENEFWELVFALLLWQQWGWVWVSKVLHLCCCNGGNICFVCCFITEIFFTEGGSWGSEVLVFVEYNKVCIKEICKFTLSSPCLSPLNPSFSGVRKVRKSQYEMLKLNAKCWISAFNAQGSRGIIVVVQVGAVKIYVATVETLRKKERQGETQKTIKNWWFSKFHPPLIVLFCRFFFYLTVCMTKLRVLTLSFPDLRISLLFPYFCYMLWGGFFLVHEKRVLHVFIRFVSCLLLG